MIMLITLPIIGFLLMLMVYVDKHIIPTLNPENRFRKWWTKHIMDVDHYDYE